jgi:hypothetical protein
MPAGVGIFSGGRVWQRSGLGLFLLHLDHPCNFDFFVNGLYHRLALYLDDTGDLDLFGHGFINDFWFGITSNQQSNNGQNQ